MPTPVLCSSFSMLRSFVLAEHEVSIHFFRTSRQSLSPFALIEFTDFVIEIHTFSFASLVIVGVNLPLMTVVFFPASCMITCTFSAVKFRLRSFLKTVTSSAFCFFLFLFPGAALTMVIDPGGSFLQYPIPK